MKYLIRDTVTAAIDAHLRAHLALDQYSQARPDGYYPIVSLYLDSPELRLYRETMNGKANRFKLRIRTYADDPKMPCFFEVKRRINTVIVKGRARVAREWVAPLLRGAATLPAGGMPRDRESLRQFLLYRNCLLARPMVLIRYLRKAYEDDSPNRVRVTFDRALTYCMTHDPAVRLGGAGWQGVPLAQTILEIKYTGRYPPWLARLAQGFDLRQQSVSKYASSLNHAALLGWRTPVWTRDDGPVPAPAGW